MCSSCEDVAGHGGEGDVFNLHWLPEAGENCGCALAVFEGVSLANRVLRASKVETAAVSDREQRRIFRLRTYDCASAAATSIPPDQFAAPVRRTTTTVSRRLLHNALGLPQVVPLISVCAFANPVVVSSSLWRARAALEPLLETLRVIGSANCALSIAGSPLARRQRSPVGGKHRIGHT
jgi:hypothetical protein